MHSSAGVSLKTSADAKFAPSSPLQVDRPEERRVASGGREAAVRDKKKARRMSDAPSNKTYGNCLLGLHCIQNALAGGRAVAGFLVVARRQQEKLYPACSQTTVDRLGVIPSGLLVFKMPVRSLDRLGKRRRNDAIPPYVSDH